jgi:hypothetical protein
VVGNNVASGALQIAAGTTGSIVDAAISGNTNNAVAAGL